MDILVTVTPFWKVKRDELMKKLREEMEAGAIPIGEKGDPFFDWLCSLSKDASDLVDKATIVPKKACDCLPCQHRAYVWKHAKKCECEWCKERLCEKAPKIAIAPKESQPLCACKVCKQIREEQDHQSAVGGKSMLEEANDRAFLSMIEKVMASQKLEAGKVEEHSMICKCPECKAADREARRIANKLIPLLEREVLAKNSPLLANALNKPSPTNEPTSGFGFEVALNYLKAGRKVRRKDRWPMYLDTARGRVVHEYPMTDEYMIKMKTNERNVLDIHSILAQDWELVMPLELNKLEPMKKAENFVSFEEALAALKKGKKVLRRGWFNHYMYQDKNCPWEGGLIDKDENIQSPISFSCDDVMSNDWLILE